MKRKNRHFCEIFSLPPPPKGCSAPVVVKIADTDKEKAQRRLQQAMTSLGNQFGGLNNLTAFGLGMNTAAYYQQAVSERGIHNLMPYYHRD